MPEIIIKINNFVGFCYRSDDGVPAVYEDNLDDVDKIELNGVVFERKDGK